MENRPTLKMPPETEDSVRRENRSQDFAPILERCGISYVAEELYYLSGTPGKRSGWMLHLSIVPQQIRAALELLLPVLKPERLAFRLVRTLSIAQAITGGHFGNSRSGKVVCIYPDNEAQLTTLARRLITLLGSFKGPQIITDRRLEGVVYTAYGPFEEISFGDANAGFQKPSKIPWPFGELQPERNIPKTPLLDRYFGKVRIKEDPKGSVWLAYTRRNFIRIRRCVIKEGRENMSYDNQGRDIRDRLSWQKELHRELKDKISLPAVYDWFEEHKNNYLVLEYINGIELDQEVKNIFGLNMWSALNEDSRKRLLNFALRILDNILLMHQQGYVHRDIHTGNFLVGKHEQLVLIDLELVYSLKENYPQPPFMLGTEGFMSPQQRAVSTPTEKEDIYGFGATLIVLLTGLLPGKFAADDPELLKEQLAFFIPYMDLVTLISRCLSYDPSERPGLLEIKSALKALNTESTITQPSKAGRFDGGKGSDDWLQETIAVALSGLSAPPLLQQGFVWHAHSESIAGNSANSSSGGLHNGLAGVLYLLAKAKSCGFNIKTSMQAYNDSLQFLQENYMQAIGQVPGGLYHGMAGIGMAMAEGIKSGLLTHNESAILNTEACLCSSNLQGATVAEGVAGQALAILRHQDLLTARFTGNRLPALAEWLLEQQQPDGSWLPASTDNKRQKIAGWSMGVAGICTVLLALMPGCKSPTVAQSVSKSLHWLQKMVVASDGKRYWYSPGRDNAWGVDHGIAGIALAFIKAFQVTGETLYRRLAEDILYQFPEKISGRDLSQASGLTGLGELYLVAGYTFECDQWLERAGWIVKVLLHQYRKPQGGFLHWQVCGNLSPTAGFMTGNSGIIHFLIRYLFKGELSHPLFTSQNMV